MRIGIDCRLYGPKDTGIGRYAQNLVENLLEIDKKNEYVLFTKENNDINLAMKQCNNVTIVKTKINHYSLQEQIFFTGIIEKEHLDLMHFPHFNVPVFYQGKYVVTIHDLIKHTSKGASTTTKSSWLYWLKYLGYKFVFNQAVKRAEKIIVPSRFVKGEVIKEYGVGEKKVAVVYEGVGTKVKSEKLKVKSAIPLQGKQSSKILERYDIKKPYLLYVGNVYPHKNIQRLVEAVKKLWTNGDELQLVIVCARSVFWERLKEQVREINAEDFVNLTGFVSDEELRVLYKEAEVFVFPTLSEGFGLPGLEAMAAGCPVVCSDISVLREVYRNAVVYFDPGSVDDIAEKIKLVMGNEDIQKRLKTLGSKLVEGYSWPKMAKETLEVYNSRL